MARIASLLGSERDRKTWPLSIRCVSLVASAFRTQSIRLLYTCWSPSSPVWNYIQGQLDLDLPSLSLHPSGLKTLSSLMARPPDRERTRRGGLLPALNSSTLERTCHASPSPACLPLAPPSCGWDSCLICKQSLLRGPGATGRKVLCSCLQQQKKKKSQFSPQKIKSLF